MPAKAPTAAPMTTPMIAAASPIWSDTWVP